MIIKSLCDETEYFWIKIPRTATHSFKLIFGKYNDLNEDKHYHYPYVDLCEKYDRKLTGITLVRHPLERFTSIIHYLAHRQEDSKSNIKQLWESTDSCINFLNSNFLRNCQPKAPHVLDLVIDLETDEFIKAHIAFFKTQTEYAYHPNVKIFRYEKMEQFIEWIKTSLGYDVQKIPKINRTHKREVVKVDFTNPDLIKTVENLYYIDYKVFNYELQYLT